MAQPRPDLLTWKERRAALRHIFPFLKMVWQTDRRATVAMVILRLLRACVPVAALWVGKLILDT
ncbi:hypothetical protein L0152_11150, partial [bacterium]|nr:hypothetical protein [bacterium]